MTIDHCFYHTYNINIPNIYYYIMYVFVFTIIVTCHILLNIYHSSINFRWFLTIKIKNLLNVYNRM